MTENESYELNLSRVFDAPRERVYRAFVDPDELARWFGPVGFTVPRETIEIDPRPGGRERFVIVNEEDPTLSSKVDAEFTDVIENELLVEKQDHAQVPDQRTPSSGPMTLRLEFIAEGHKTGLLLRQSPYNLELEADARQGWESSFTKLDELLAGRPI